MHKQIMKKQSVIIHYIINSANDQTLNKTKLNKILWFADLEFYIKFRRTITGESSYPKAPRGPVFEQLDTILEMLEHKKAIVSRKRQSSGYFSWEYWALGEPDLSILSASEVAHIDKILYDITKNHTASSISKLTHDVLWEETEMGKPISIAAASIMPSAITDSDMSWAIKVMKEAS